MAITDGGRTEDLLTVFSRITVTSQATRGMVDRDANRIRFPAGGDMGEANVNSFEACIDLCDSTAGCVDVSLSGVACYL